jgi:EmrB/QacA subfamily drug resistance transporter
MFTKSSEAVMNTKRWTLVVVNVATAMLMLDIAVVNTALPRIGEDLDTGLTGLQWVVDAYTLTLATTVLTAGALADRIGRRRLFAVGLGIFTVSSLAAALAGSIEVLNTARAVQGIGGAILFATSLALLAHAFPGKKERTGALAIYGATIGGSFAFGPLVGGALTSGLDWQWVFLINIPVGIAALAISLTRVEESRDPRPRRIDWPGQLTLMAGLALLVLGLLRGNEDGWTSTPIVLELSGALVFLAAFVAIEARVREPMLPLGMFRKRAFTGAQVAAFAISGSLYAVYIYATLYVQGVLGLSAVEAGLVLLPGTILNFIVAGATAQILERGVRPGALVSAGLAFAAAGMVLMTTVGVESSWTAILPGLMIGMVGAGLFNPSVIAVALDGIPDDQSGLAAGINDTARQAGIAVGVAGLGALIPHGSALGGDPVAYVDGLQNALLAGGALAAAGAVAAALLIGVRRPRTASAVRPELATESA